MRVFFDTEFIEDGKTIDLISIGLVCDDGRHLYAVSSEFDAEKADDWVQRNVLAHIPEDQVRYPRKHIASLIENFLFGDEPEFWAYFADYDWVVLCQLYGRMIDLPKGWPKYCRDLKQLSDETGIKLPEQKGVEHHALADAEWVAQAYTFLRGREQWLKPTPRP